MQDVIEFLSKNPILYLSTVGLDDKPKVRPFQFMFEKEGKLYFCTSNDKNVCKEMQKQSNVEFCICGENYSWIRLNGKATFTNDLAIKEKIFEISPIVKSIYQTPDNPIFEAFYLDEASATIADLSGQPPKTFDL